LKKHFFFSCVYLEERRKLLFCTMAHKGHAANKKETTQTKQKKHAKKKKKETTQIKMEPHKQKRKRKQKTKTEVKHKTEVNRKNAPDLASRHVSYKLWGK